MSKKKSTSPTTKPTSIKNTTTGKQQYYSVLSLDMNFLNMFQTTEEATTDGVTKQAGSLGFSSFLANKNKGGSEDRKNPRENIVGTLASKFLGKFQTFFRELKKQSSLQYTFKPNQVEFHKISQNDSTVALGRKYLLESIEDSSITGPDSSKKILIPANTILADLDLDSYSGAISLKVISEEDLLRRYFNSPRVLTQVQLNLTSDFLKIINSMVVESNVVVPLNVTFVEFKPDDLLGLLQILEKLQLKDIHLMPLEKDYKYGSNKTIPPEKIAQINQLINKINSEISITSTLFSRRGSSLARQNQDIPGSPSSSPPNVSTNPTGPKDKR